MVCHVGNYNDDRNCATQTLNNAPPKVNSLCKWGVTYDVHNAYIACGNNDGDNRSVINNEIVYKPVHDEGRCGRVNQSKVQIHLNFHTLPLCSVQISYA